MELTGLHHVSAITGHAAQNLAFYTGTMGLRLVKKTVNQDDVTSYHFFYGDERGRPGTEVTFFDWRHAVANKPGAGAISRIALSVDGADAVRWWRDRITDAGLVVSECRLESDTPAIDFTDLEGQALMIVGAKSDGVPWSKSSVPAPYGISGMHHVELTVRSFSSISAILVDLLGMRQVSDYKIGGKQFLVFEIGNGGAGKQVHVVESSDSEIVRLGAGGVHHVAFRTPNAEEQLEWLKIVTAAGLHVSPMIDRFYFKSIYFREPGGILFEIATDGPGFASDEEQEHLGEKLALPPFLEPRRAQIEAGLIPVRPL